MEDILGRIVNAKQASRHIIRREQLIPLLRGLRARALADAALVSAAHLQPLPRAHVQLAIELRGRLLAVDEVAEAAAHTTLAAVEAAASLAEVGDGG